MGKWTKTIKNELNNIFPTHKNQFIEDSEFITSFSYQSVRIAGQEVLRASMLIQHKNIEKRWFKYCDELLIQNDLILPTVTTGIRNLGLANSIIGDSIVLDGMNKDEIVQTLRKIFNLFKDKINYYTSVHNCNQLINKDINIIDGIGQFTSLQGLPYRKVILAQETNDPRLSEIKEAMHSYCEEMYEIGNNQNIEQFKRMKPVFEKLFL